MNIPLREIDAWIENELNGYRDREKVPQYRVVRTEVEAQDHWGRWIPVVFEDGETWEIVSTVPLYDSVAEMEALLENTARENVGRLTIPFAPEQAELLIRGSQNRLMPTRFARTEDLRGVLDTVRTQILTWCLRLEKDGILGEDITFSKEEQKAAERHYTTYFHIGTMTHSQIQHMRLRHHRNPWKLTCSRQKLRAIF